MNRSTSSSNTTSRFFETRASTTRLALLERDLYDCGFDIFVPFHPQWYNDCLDQQDSENFQHLLRLPSSSSCSTVDGRCDDDKNTGVEMSEEAYLIGNTKHLWPFFKAWLREQENDDDGSPETASQKNDDSLSPPPASSPSSKRRRLKNSSHHPLDLYCQECIERCVEKHFHQQEVQQPQELNDDLNHEDDDDNDKNSNAEECNQQQYKPSSSSASASSSYRIYWSCTFAPDQMVSMQHVAMVSGLAYFDPLTNLCVHPIYGTWHAYRAVLVMLRRQEPPPFSKRGATPPPPPPPRIPCLLSVSEQENARVALARAIELCTTIGRHDNDLASTNMSNVNNDVSSSRSSSSHTCTADQKKICFDLLLHGQNKNQNKIKQQDYACNQYPDDDDAKNTSTRSQNQRHDTDDNKNDSVAFFLAICQAWIDLRDCVQTGKEEYRYEYDQLMYHITKDKRYLLDSTD